MKLPVKILGISGSPNKTGTCTRLLLQALRAAKKSGAHIEIVHLIDIERTFYKSHYGTEPERDFKRLAKKLLSADGFIFATPVYWMNMSSLMKNLFEKLTVFEINNFKLEGKVAGFITTCEEDGGWKAALDMAGPLDHMGVLFPPYSMVFYNKKFSKRSERGWMKKDIELLGQNVVELCKILKLGQPKWGYRD